MNKVILKNCLMFLFVLSHGSMAMAQQSGDILNLKFDAGNDEVWYGGNYRLVTKDGQSAILIKSKSSNKLYVDLPVEKMRGAAINVKARLKARNVSTPPKPWNGVKIMLHITLPWTDIWPQARINSATNGWREVSFSTTVPENADTAQLVFGLEEVKGTLWIDNIEVSLASAPQSAKDTGLGTAEPKHHTNFRGAMIPPNISAADLKDLAGWGANLVRWQLIWDGFPSSGADTATAPQYTAWLNRAVAQFDSMLPICRQSGLKVILDLHTLPGGRDERQALRLFTDSSWQKVFVEVWKQLTSKYKDEETIYAYDIANEPAENELPEGVASWQSLAEVTAKEIRATDSKHPIIVEGADGGSPWGLLSMHRINVPGIIYSFHMYEPATFTHQGLYGNPSGVYYPSKMGRTEWNKTTLKQLLGEIRKWQVRNDAGIYVGEFSAIRWSPGESAYYYLRDCIELFEEFGWDWSYHAFREFDGWSVEHGNDRNNTEPEKKATLRQQLLMEWYGKNKH